MKRILPLILVLATASSALAAKPKIISPLTATGQVGVVFTYQIMADQAITTWGAAGLPAGLTVNTATGMISSTPAWGTDAASPYSVTLSATNSSNQTGTATLTYTIPRGSVSLSYQHGVTSGSGVFVGSTTDQLTASGTRRLTRVWTGDVHLGFAHNRRAETSPILPDQSFNTVYAGASVARPLGRDASFSLGYTAYVETSSNVGGFSLTTHQISVGLSWHTRPFVLH